MKKSEAGFTLMELLIVVALLVLLAMALLVSLNPWGQINKGQDSKRKSEMSTIEKILEDWYNDKNCYPTSSQICYDNSSDGSCHICGNESDSPNNLSSYLSSLICDPLHPTKDYLYQTDGSSCPNWFVIYTILSNTNDSAISEVGCQNGCGPTGNVNYNYFVSSSNITLEGGIGPTSSVPIPTSTTSPQSPTSTPIPNPTSTPGPTVNPTSTPNPLTPTIPQTPTPTINYASNYICCDINSLCQSCGTYNQCVSDPGCRSDSEIYLLGSVTCHSICQ